MYRQLPAAKFYGVGPKQSLDQKINFINENNNLARKIVEVNKRKDFITGLVDKKHSDKQRKHSCSFLTPKLSSVSRIKSHKPSEEKVIAKGRDSGSYQLGSLNKESRNKRHLEINKLNRVIATTLIDCKPHVSFAEHLVNSQKVSVTSPFIYLETI